ncbi:flagellin [Planktomarina temperata]|nr:flagellin [Planktomarina temperata]
MSMVINTNTASLVAQAAQASNNKALDTAMERLSTGMRINAASDDAAGLSIATRMESNISGMNQAIRNAMDAQSLIDTAESSQAETMNLMQRIRELAVQASNDTNSQSDRLALNAEVTQLRTEIDRIASTTTWAGQNLLDGTFVGKSFQIGSFAGETLKINQDAMTSANLGEHSYETVGMASAAETTATATMASTGFTVLGKDGSAAATVTAEDTAKALAAAVNVDTADTGVKAAAHSALQFAFGASTAPTTTTSFSLNGGGTAQTISASITDVTDLTALVTAINSKSGTTGVTAEFNGTDKSKLILREQDGDNITIEGFSSLSGSSNLTATITEQSNYEGTSFSGAITLTSAGDDSTIYTGVAKLTSTEAFALSKSSAGTAANSYFGDDATSKASSLDQVSQIDISTRAGAEAALSVLDTAMLKVAESRGELGAVSNRLDSTVANLTAIVTNTAASQSRIQDADFAAETSNLTKSQILSQAATAMLAQANASKQGVLSLLQG